MGFHLPPITLIVAATGHQGSGTITSSPKETHSDSIKIVRIYDNETTVLGLAKPNHLDAYHG
jgi:hypothetical protein